MLLLLDLDRYLLVTRSKRSRPEFSIVVNGGVRILGLIIL